MPGLLQLVLEELLTGVSMFLKDKNPQVKCIVADPMGSGLYSYVKTGEN